MKFLAVPDINILIVNNELTKIKITVVINLKWYNLDYPCYLDGSPTFKVSGDHRTLYSLSGGARTGRLYCSCQQTVNKILCAVDCAARYNSI